MSAERGLRRALLSLFADPGLTVIVDDMRSRPWASATFSGRRHTSVLRLNGPGAETAAETVLTEIGELEFEIPGHILVDIACESEERVGRDVVLTLGALTIEAD